MAISRSYSSDKDTTYLIEPNRSLSRCQLLLAGGIIVAALLAVALYFSLQGAWLVLPFAGLETALIFYVVYAQCRWSRQQQRIRIGERDVWADHPGTGDKAAHFIRGWLRIDLIKPVSSWHPSRLVVGAQGRFMELGAFLEEGERKELALMLSIAIRPQSTV